MQIHAASQEPAERGAEAVVPAPKGLAPPPPEPQVLHAAAPARPDIQSIEAEAACQVACDDADSLPKASAPEAGAVADECECVVCWAEGLEVVFQPCGHLCVCSACAQPFLQGLPCPMCRLPVEAGIFL